MTTICILERKKNGSHKVGARSVILAFHRRRLWMFAIKKYPLCVGSWKVNRHSKVMNEFAPLFRNMFCCCWNPHLESLGLKFKGRMWASYACCVLSIIASYVVLRKNNNRAFSYWEIDPQEVASSIPDTGKVLSTIISLVICSWHLYFFDRWILIS